MDNPTLIKPGKWYAEFDENGAVVSYHHDAAVRELLGGKTGDADEYGSWKNALHPDDRERVLRYIADFTKNDAKNADFDIEYRIMTQWGYHAIHVNAYGVRREDGSVARVNGIAFDIQHIAEAVERQIEQKNEQLEKKQVQLKEALAFTDYFLGTYVSAYYIDLVTCDCQIYKRTQTLENDYPIIDNYYDGIMDYIRRDVHPDDRDELARLMRPDNLMRILKERAECAYFYRDISEGKEKNYKVQIIRGADEDHAAFGFVDVTDELRRQQKHLLGAIPLSSDILTKANIGLWSFELDEGRPPRMYADEAMLGLIGLDHQVTPEETYHAWYDHIDESSYDLVADAVAKMTSGEHAEVQYPWHYPDGRTVIVRCGGVRNFDYTNGIRIEGTHQDVSQMIHFDEEARKRAKQLEMDLTIEKLRTEALTYIAENDPDPAKAIDFFGQRLLDITGCDQVIFRSTDGTPIVLNAPGITSVPQEVCAACPMTDFENEIYGDDDLAVINDWNEGCRGIRLHPKCPRKSSYLQRIYCDGELAGLFSIHYMKAQHPFSESAIRNLKAIGLYLGLLIGRVREKQSEIARIKAESSSKAKSEFLFNMSHDIRTPMNAILGYTDVALNHIGETERVKDGLRKIKTSGGHLLKLINDILEMSRIEAGKMEIINAPMNMAEAAEGVVNMTKALATKKSIQYIAEIVDLPNPYVYADELHTNQILLNIISNAIKYTNPGGSVKYRIEQISEPKDGRAQYRFTIADNGIGMSEEFQKHLFESFSREQTEAVNKLEGTGLGLAIVKRIVDLIGGTICVRSRVGEGSVFVVELPFEVMDDDAIRAYKASQTREVFIPENVSFAGRKVLLVEDNEMNREIAAEILEEAGLKIETAEDGDLAVKKVMEKGADYFDFILMDIQMPVMNGYEATAEIRKLPDGKNVPIIALSANAFMEDKERSLAAGMNAHIAKPIDVKQLFETLAKFR